VPFYPLFRIPTILILIGIIFFVGWSKNYPKTSLVFGHLELGFPLGRVAHQNSGHITKKVTGMKPCNTCPVWQQKKKQHAK
jgi:hypothetical protein